MTSKELLNRWTKLCLRKKNTPIALLTVSEDGFPHVFTQHNPELLSKVYKHLLDSGPTDEVKYFTNHEK